MFSSGRPNIQLLRSVLAAVDNVVTLFTVGNMGASPLFCGLSISVPEG